MKPLLTADAHALQRDPRHIISLQHCQPVGPVPGDFTLSLARRAAQAVPLRQHSPAHAASCQPRRKSSLTLVPPCRVKELEDAWMADKALYRRDAQEQRRRCHALELEHEKLQVRQPGPAVRHKAEVLKPVCGEEQLQVSHLAQPVFRWCM